MQVQKHQNVDHMLCNIYTVGTKSLFFGVLVIRAFALTCLPDQAEPDISNPFIQNKFVRMAITGGICVGSLITEAKG